LRGVVFGPLVWHVFATVFSMVNFLFLVAGGSCIGGFSESAISAGGSLTIGFLFSGSSFFLCAGFSVTELDPPSGMAGSAPGASQITGGKRAAERSTAALRQASGLALAYGRILVMKMMWLPRCRPGAARIDYY